MSKVVSVSELRGIIEAVCTKRDLPVNRRFVDLRFTDEDMARLNERMRERFNHKHNLEVYLVDSIEDVARILNEDF